MTEHIPEMKLSKFQNCCFSQPETYLTLSVIIWCLEEHCVILTLFYKQTYCNNLQFIAILQSILFHALMITGILKRKDSESIGGLCEKMKSYNNGKKQVEPNGCERWIDLGGCFLSIF